MTNIPLPGAFDWSDGHPDRLTKLAIACPVGIKMKCHQWEHLFASRVDVNDIRAIVATCELINRLYVFGSTRLVEVTVAFDLDAPSE